MILVENRNILRSRHRSLLNRLTELESKDENSVVVETSKKGTATLKININDKDQYLHSKYDPELEAERLIEKLESVDKYDHVLFIGTGIGYHIKSFLNKYPTMKFSMYEPNMEVLVNYLSENDLSNLQTPNLQSIFTYTDEQSLRQEVQNLIKTLGNNILIVTLPVYAKLYSNEILIVMGSIKEMLKEKKSNLVTNLSFQKRWTINSLKNFPYVLKSPNILHDVDNSAFKDKPAIIVAAGPSLSEEFENLRYIKENGLAYLFSVGSAINALIEHDIYPDAACTYDPTVRNQKVIQKIKEKNITQIPLIFGSSVGFETLENYPGPMLHMITSQDTVTPYFIDSGSEVNIVQDAPSIAVVTFQLLNLLGCKQIILVGQNLAYRDKNRYAEGIKYDYVANELSEKEMKNTIVVQDVHGNDVLTTEGFNRMRQQLEMYIQSSTDVEIINTTKDGAHIEGTTFIPLSKVISAKLSDKVVDFNWYDVSNVYNLDYIENQVRIMNRYQHDCERAITSSINELKEIDKLVKSHLFNRLEISYNKFDRHFDELKKNQFYQALIEPMVRVQYQRLTEKNKLIQFEKKPIKKGVEVVNSFGKFLLECRLHTQFVLPYFKDLSEQFYKKRNNQE